MLTPSFGRFVADAAAAGELVVQPRVGFSDPARMRVGLAAVKAAPVTSVGTIILDSYTRVGDHRAARRALDAGADLNGYPIVAHDPSTTAAVLDGVHGPGFPVQVRHGSAVPQDIVVALRQLGLHATGSGPVSYCLPYGRTPLYVSVDNWARSCELLADGGAEAHLETFGGCMMGQLCPPGLLVAISLLEAVFFRAHGIRSVSLSCAQQTDSAQDEEAVLALRLLAAEFLPDVNWHVVVYAHMGVYPRTPAGARGLLEAAARCTAPLPGTGDAAASETYREARALVDAVLELDADPGRALVRAFARGVLDVPYCLHPDNQGCSRGYVDDGGRLRWARTRAMPIAPAARVRRAPLTAADLMSALSYVERRWDVPTRPSGSRPMTQSPDTATSRPMPASLGEHLSSPVTRAVLRVQHGLLVGAREHLSDTGFTELLPPIIGPVTDPGARGAKQVDVDYYGARYKLMTSAILYKQASMLAFDQIFYVAPNVRLEPLETCNTDRHLAEFHQIDVEAAGASRDEVLALITGLIRHAVGHVVAHHPDDLELLGRDPAAFAGLLDGAFDRVTHAEAVARLRAMGHDQSPDAEIDWAGEAMLSRAADRPFFITDYPKGSRGFYDREDPEAPGVLRNFDLIAPEGFGELISGSERESDYARVVSRMRETGENPAKYGWYLKMLREGIPASAGFGIGVQRLTRYVTGVDAVWQATAYPKVPGVIAP